MGITSAIATDSMNPTKRFLRQLLPRSLESAVGVPPGGVAVTLCATIAPITLPRQPEASQGMPSTRGVEGTMPTSNGTTEAAKVGNFAQNPLRPLGATQNWQNARYNAAATHAALISRNEVVPGVSKADAAPTTTSSAVIPRKRDTTTIMRMRDQSLRAFIDFL